MPQHVSKEMPDQKCIWCDQEKTFFMGEDGWFRYFHCPSCSADFPVNMEQFAWTADEIDKQRKKELVDGQKNS